MDRKFHITLEEVRNTAFIAKMLERLFGNAVETDHIETMLHQVTTGTFNTGNGESFAELCGAGIDYSETQDRHRWTHPNRRRFCAFMKGSELNISAVADLDLLHDIIVDLHQIRPGHDVMLHTAERVPTWEAQQVIHALRHKRVPALA